jgi:DNA mismatch endonuclease (patch repair protein)
MPGDRRRADIVFNSARIIVDVRGCWWHGCQQHRSLPKTNTDWWAAKIARNVARDQDTERQLEALGWLVVIVWEHQDTDAAADKVERLVRERKQAPRKVMGRQHRTAP